DELRAALPEESIVRSANIIKGNESIVSGSICVENYHQTLPSVRSSLRVSLEGKGDRTLVLNDEAHHLYSATGDLKRWAEFVADPRFGFRYVIGVSGTCYDGDSYFPDVISRYSLRDAIDAGFVKTVD